MLGNAGSYLNVARIVVRSFTINVVNLLTCLQSPADLFFGDNPVFIGIASYVCEVMADAHADEHVAV